MGFKFLINLNTVHKSCISRFTSSSRIVANSHAALNPNPYDHSSSRSVNPNFTIFRRWHGGHSHHHHDHRDSHSGKEGEKIFRLGLASDIGLAVGKIVTGYLSVRTAIIADAAHSVSDVVLSGVALLSFKAATAPKDKEHPYGHGQFETLGALGISSVLLVTAGGIAWHALDVLADVWSAAPDIVNQASGHNHVHGHSHQHGGHYHGIDMDHPIRALNMTLVSIAVKEGLYWITKRAGERTGSGLMKANAWHHRADAISSAVALVGFGGSVLGVRFLDPLAGLLVSGMIFKAGLESGYQSVLELVDAAIPSQHLEPNKQTILGVEGVKGYNRLRGRRAGSYLYLDVDVKVCWISQLKYLVDPFSSVSAAHDVGENVCRQLQQSHPEVAEVFIHVEPATAHISANDVNYRRNCTRSDLSNTTLSEQTDIEDTVSMPPDTLMREAVEVAKEAEKKIMEVVPNIIHASVQLRLGRPMPDLQHLVSGLHKIVELTSYLKNMYVKYVFVQ